MTTMAGVGGSWDSRNSATPPSVVEATCWLGIEALDTMVTGCVFGLPPAIKALAISARFFTAIYMTMTGAAVATACQFTFAGILPVASWPVRKITEWLVSRWVAGMPA